MNFACENDMNLRGLGVECYGLDISVPQKSYVEIIMPHIMVQEGGAFGR